MWRNPFGGACAARKLGGLKFRRQHPVGRFVADFVCLEPGSSSSFDGRQRQGAYPTWFGRTN
jgi:very-short-patch-repair endonuclease